MEEILISRNVDIQHGDPEQKRAEILKYFECTWELDEQVYTTLKSDEVFYHRGDPLRHVILFYYGHTASFYINKLVNAKVISERVNPDYESIFAIGVDEMSWDDLNNQHYNWPEAPLVRDYRVKVKEIMINLIKTLPLSIPIKWEDPFYIVLMGIEHSRIHLETSSVLIRQLPLDEVVSGRFGKICTKSGEPPKNELLPVPGAMVHLGKPRDHIFYGWDNEYGTLDVNVKDFKASKYLISNREFLDFIKDGGYHKQEYWTEEGWNWRNFKEAEMPLFWHKNGEDYKLRLVAEEIPMPWNWPVEVNCLEAKAYANWMAQKTGKPIRLPTEAEWFRLHEHACVKDMNLWGEKAPGNINLEHYTSECPVDEFKFGDFYDVIGNVWQHTETPIDGFHGYKVHPIYDDFTTPTIDGKHNMIKGGSWVSTGNEATKNARYAFRRHFYQFAGFRVIESNDPVVIKKNEYEFEPDVTLSCEFNWGDEFATLPNFAKELMKVILPAVQGKQINKVLDLNADTGRLAFELSQHYKDITALDFTARFLRFAIQLQEQGIARYIMKDEGELVFYREIILSNFKLESNAKNILFMQADALNIKSLYTGYDLVIIPNLLEELHTPALLLEKIHERMNPKGTLIIASTYEWDITRTKRENWIGGFKKDGEQYTSLDGIKDILQQRFVQQGEPKDIIYEMKKSSRVSELKKTQITVWQLK